MTDPIPRLPAIPTIESPRYQRIVSTYEKFVNIAAIPLGILQVVSLRYAQHIHGRLPLWFRTVRQKLAPSENLVRCALQAEALRIFATSGRISLRPKFSASAPEPIFRPTLCASLGRTLHSSVI